jgi:hypothetical protein
MTEPRADRWGKGHAAAVAVVARMDRNYSSFNTIRVHNGVLNGRPNPGRLVETASRDRGENSAILTEAFSDPGAVRPDACQQRRRWGSSSAGQPSQECHDGGIVLHRLVLAFNRWVTVRYCDNAQSGWQRSGLESERRRVE